MAELGWAGIVLPEELGGAELGYAELGLVLEECGRTLAATPLVSTVLLGANALLLAGNGTQQKDLLGAVAQGRDRARARAGGRPAPRALPGRDPRRGDEGRLQAHRQEDVRARRPRRRPADRRRAHRRASPASATASACSWCRRARAGSTVKRTTMVDSRNAAQRRARRRRGRQVRARRPRGPRRRPARRGARPRDDRPRRGAARHGDRSLRAHRRLPEDAHAVRRADRLVPGAEAPRRRDVHRGRALALDRPRRAPRRSTRSARTWRCSRRSPRRASPTRRSSSATRPSRCTAASASPTRTRSASS